VIVRTQEKLFSEQFFRHGFNSVHLGLGLIGWIYETATETSEDLPISDSCLVATKCRNSKQATRQTEIW
jgi:hypothetical protein